MFHSYHFRFKLSQKNVFLTISEQNFGERKQNYYLQRHSDQSETSCPSELLFECFGMDGVPTAAVDGV